MDTSQANVAHLQGKIHRRVLTLFWLKAIGSTVVISTFFVAYFVVLNHPFTTVRTMPLLALDRWIPVVHGSAWVYFSLWFYIWMPSSLMVQVHELGEYLLGAFILSVIGVSIFYFLPTQVPSWEIDWSQYPTLQFLKNSDASGNACPSLHVAFSFYSGLWLARVLRLLQAGRTWHLVNALWCLLIVLSTMTTKQHVFVDVICGSVLGVFVFWLNDRILRKTRSL